jgi:hypothetical protein
MILFNDVEPSEKIKFMIQAMNLKLMKTKKVLVITEPATLHSQARYKGSACCNGSDLFLQSIVINRYLIMNQV